VSAELPAPRDPGATYLLGLVCLGNICRSPMAQVVLERRLVDAGLASRVHVESSGTGDWHIGEPMDRRAAATLAGAGYDPSRHRARQVDAEMVREYDAVLVMDESNLRDVRRLARDGAPERILLFRCFDPAADGDDLEVPDPWYGGPRGFDDVLAIVERTSDTLVELLAAR
jgi:protein-tyrosine phosphatase